MHLDRRMWHGDSQLDSERLARTAAIGIRLRKKNNRTERRRSRVSTLNFSEILELMILNKEIVNIWTILYIDDCVICLTFMMSPCLLASTVYHLGFYQVLFQSVSLSVTSVSYTMTMCSTERVMGKMHCK